MGEEPLLTQTVRRVLGMVPEANVLVLTNADLLAEVARICPMLPPGNIVGEPVGRDTAAAVGLATVLVRLRKPGGQLCRVALGSCNTRRGRIPHGA